MGANGTGLSWERFPKNLRFVQFPKKYWKLIPRENIIKWSKNSGNRTKQSKIWKMSSEVVPFFGNSENGFPFVTGNFQSQWDYRDGPLMFVFAFFESFSTFKSYKWDSQRSARWNQDAQREEGNEKETAVKKNHLFISCRLRTDLSYNSTKKTTDWAFRPE